MAASAYGVDPGEIVRDRARMHALLGIVEASGLVLWASMPQEHTGKVGALAIRGCALDSMLEGWRLIISTTLQPSAELRDRRLYVVQHEDGTSTVRKVTRSSRSLWHLEGWGTATQFDRSLAGGFEVVGIEPT